LITQARCRRIRTAQALVAILFAMLILSPSARSAAKTDEAKSQTGNPPAGGDQAAPADSSGFDLAAYRGKVVYLDFWASWCKPCKQSFPWMTAIQRRFAREGFEVVAVDLDRDPKAASAFLEKNHPAFRILHDPEGKMAEAHKIKAMPTSILYDRQGKQRSVHLGFKSSDTEPRESEIASLLAESPPDSTRR
jgi:cytochrome c biogenesis protein CcmG/thiol:disulfide interchange protein DsbE